MRYSERLVEMSLEDRVKESKTIVSGEVIKILPSVETKDIFGSEVSQATKDGYYYLHTDIVLKVDEWITDDQKHKEIVIRRYGGRLGNFVHLNHMENYEVGEKVLLFQLEQLDEVNQVPEGFSKEQYYILQPNSKYVSHKKNNFVSEFVLENDKQEKTTIKEIKTILSNDK